MRVAIRTKLGDHSVAEGESNIGHSGESSTMLEKIVDLSPQHVPPKQQLSRRSNSASHIHNETSPRGGIASH